MYEFIKDLTDPITHLIKAVLWFLPRTIMCFSVWPLFSQMLTGPFLRNGAAVAIALIPASFYINSVQSVSRTPFDIVLFALRESAFGLLLGLTTALPFFTFRAFGAFIDVYRGATFATLIDPTTGNDELVTEKLMSFLFTLLIISGPSLMLTVNSLYNSFLVIPPGFSTPESFRVWVNALVDLFGRHMLYAVILTGPILIGVFLIEVALSIISVYAPSLQIYSIEATLKTTAALFILIAMLEFAGDDILKVVNHNIELVNKLFLAK
ncbi:MAG: EscT/YscT/HrcT family type III secretion system export apparatus protein [Burkholderiaceae bacterium]|jgi:type III secretion protein T